MNAAKLNEQLLARTGHKVGLREAVEAYLRAVHHNAELLEVSLIETGIASDSAGIILRLAAQPSRPVGWEPSTGWFWDTEDYNRIYWTSDDGDAAGVIPDADTTAAWLKLLASGDRSGHEQAGTEPAGDDLALIDRLAAYAYDSF